LWKVEGIQPDQELEKLEVIQREQETQLGWVNCLDWESGQR
jgi:hypothetical protein